MAVFSISNLMAVAQNIARRVKTIADVMPDIQSDLSAQKSRYDGFGDTYGIGARLVGAALRQEQRLGLAYPYVADLELRELAMAFQDPDNSPDVSSLDESFTQNKSSFSGEPLLPHEFCVVYRAVNGDGSLSAENCSAATDTLYGSWSQSAGATLVSEPIDTTLYAGGLLKLVITTTIEGSGTVTLKGKTLSGDVWEGSATLDNNTQGAEVDVTPAIEHTYPVELTQINVGVGITAGAFDVKVKQPYEYGR